MKKLCIITCGFEGTGGGRIASILENAFSKEYETVTLIGFHDKKIFPIKGKKLYLGHFGKKEFPGRGWIALIPHIINTIRYLHNEKPGIVITIGTYCNFLGLVAQKFLKFKLLLTQHEHITTKIKTDATLLDKILFKLNKYLISNNHIVCVSKEVLKDTIRFYNIPKEQATTIYNGLNFKSIQSLGNEPVGIKDKYIINIGSLDDRKNQETLIKAYAKTQGKNNYKLLLLGEGPKKDYLVNLAKDLSIQKNVIFAGFKDNPYRYLKNASIFCFTSLSEALPTVLIEPLILKVPILTVPVVGSREILDNGNCGIITKDWDIEKYSKLLDEYLIKDNTEMVKKGYKYAEEKFEITAMIQNYSKIIKSII